MLMFINILNIVALLFLIIYFGRNIYLDWKPRSKEKLNIYDCKVIDLPVDALHNLFLFLANKVKYLDEKEREEQNKIISERK